MKYMVIIKKWSEEQNKQVKVVAGQFNRFLDAKLFKDAYDNYYRSNSEIIEVDKLIND